MKKLLVVGLVIVIFAAACSKTTGENGIVQIYAAPPWHPEDSYQPFSIPGPQVRRFPASQTHGNTAYSHYG